MYKTVFKIRVRHWMFLLKMVKITAGIIVSMRLDDNMAFNEMK